jgi:hypothetical protein
MVIYVLERYLQLGNVRLRLGTLFNVLERINRIFRVSEKKQYFSIIMVKICVVQKW